MADHETFRRHWVKWQPAIYGYIRTVVLCRADAEDVLQDVAEILWRKIDDYQEGTRFDQWAYRVARNVLLNYQKKAKRQRLCFSDELTRQLVDETDPTESRAELDALEACIGKLPDDQRALVRKRYLPEATNRSVAVETGRSESSISRALSRIHQALARCVSLTLGQSVPAEVVK